MCHEVIPRLKEHKRSRGTLEVEQNRAFATCISVVVYTQYHINGCIVAKAVGACRNVIPARWEATLNCTSPTLFEIPDPGVHTRYLHF